MTDTTTKPRHNQAARQRAPRWMLWGPITLFAILFGCYWLVWQRGADYMRSEVDLWIDQQKQIGARVEHGEIKIKGFPFFLRAEILNPVLDYPGSWGWSGDFLLVDASPMKPSQLILTPSPKLEAHLTHNNYRRGFDIAARDAHFTIADGLFAIQSGPAQFAEQGGSLAKINFDKIVANYTISDSPENGRAQDYAALLIDAKDFTYTDNSVAAVRLPVFELSISTSQFNALNAGDLSTWEHASGQAYLDRFRLVLDGSDGLAPAQLAATGKFHLKEAYPTGKLDTKIKHPKVLIDRLIREQMITREQGEQANTTFELMTNGSEDGEIKASFSLADGKVKLGPIIVGTLEKLR